jgi:hypothetical protein
MSLNFATRKGTVLWQLTDSRLTAECRRLQEWHQAAEHPSLWNRLDLQGRQDARAVLLSDLRAPSFHKHLRHVILASNRVSYLWHVTMANNRISQLWHVTMASNRVSQLLHVTLAIATYQSDRLFVTEG